MQTSTQNPAAQGARGASNSDLAWRLIDIEDTPALTKFQARRIALAFGLTLETAAAVCNLAGIGRAS